MSNPNFDQIISSTLQNYTPRFEDNIFGARVLLDWLKRKATISEDGGRSIVKPIMNDTNNTVAYYSEWDTVDTTPQEGFTSAEYDWVQLAGSIAWSGLQNAKNAGKERVIDLLKAKMNQLENALATKLNQSFHAASVASLAPQCLGTLVDATSTIGNINSTTYTYWRSYVNALAGPLTLAALSAANDGIALGTPDTPDLWITTATLFEKYESLLQPSQRYSDPKTADAGFVNLLYKGVPFVYDPDCASGVVYALNSKYLQLVKHSDNWMRQTGWKEPVNGDQKYKQIFSYFNLVTNNRRRLGKITGATA